MQQAHRGNLEQTVLNNVFSQHERDIQLGDDIELTNAEEILLRDDIQHVSAFKVAQLHRLPVMFVKSRLDRISLKMSRY